jgi:hypothetical protein
MKWPNGIRRGKGKEQIADGKGPTPGSGERRGDRLVARWEERRGWSKQYADPRVCLPNVGATSLS